MRGKWLILARVQLMEAYGVNEALHSRDGRKRNRMLLMGCCYGLLVLLGISWSAGMGMAFVQMGMEEIVPVYLLMAVSVAILFFTIYKAGAVIFAETGYGMLFSLPVTGRAIVASRMAVMYVGNLAFSVVLMLPGCLVCALMGRTGPWFAAAAAVGILVSPLIPMSIAGAVGGLIMAVSSRMKHKNLISSALLLLSTLAIVALAAGLSLSGGELSERELVGRLVNLSEKIAGQVRAVYPPALLFGRAASGDAVSLLLFLLLSVGMFAAFMALISWKFTAISQALRSHEAKGGYALGEQRQIPVGRALFQKEMRRYFSSRMYMVNTLVGYVMLLMMGAAVLFMGRERMEGLGVPAAVLNLLLPYAMALVCGMTYPSLSSVSIEGKYWWLIQSLPVRTKEVFDSKIKLSLAVSLPFTGLAALLAALGLSPGGAAGIWFFLVPAVFNLFFAVLGVFINARMPSFDWENETYVVKQSAAVFVGMLAGLVSTAAACALVLLFPASAAAVDAGVCLLLLVLTAGLYRANNRMELRKIR